MISFVFPLNSTTKRTPMTNQTELQEAVEGLKNRARHDEYTNGKDINVVLTALADAQMANRLIGNERDELLELRDQLCKERARDTSDLEQQARVIVRLFFECYSDHRDLHSFPTDALP